MLTARVLSACDVPFGSWADAVRVVGARSARLPRASFVVTYQGRWS
jgi:hypothetical protein